MQEDIEKRNAEKQLQIDQMKQTIQDLKQQCGDQKHLKDLITDLENKYETLKQQDEEQTKQHRERMQQIDGEI